MLPKLTEIEARVIGCLMEKSVVTPDQYPLTLNALTTACNQKSSREPVMALKPGEVQRAARTLAGRSLVHIEENFKSGVEKYKQRLCNTRFADIQLDRPQFAILTLLLLRGAQTPGELRSRSPRLHAFDDNAAVSAAANALTGEDHNALLVHLPRAAGRRDAEYMHQLCGPVDVTARAGSAAARGSTGARVAELEARIRELEHDNAELRARLGQSG